MRKITIGLFCPVNQDMTQYINRLQGLGEVRLILPRQPLGPIDLLIYPGDMGILPDTPGFSHGKRVFISSKPINPYFMLFWNERPFQTIIEDRNIPIIGIGDAAAMLYSELGGKLVVNPDGDTFLLDKEGDIIEFFNEGKVYGATKSGSFTRALQQAIDDVITNDAIEDIEGDDDLDDDGPEVPKLPPSPPPRLREKE